MTWRRERCLREVSGDQSAPVGGPESSVMVLFSVFFCFVFFFVTFFWGGFVVFVFLWVFGHFIGDFFVSVFYVTFLGFGAFIVVLFLVVFPFFWEFWCCPFFFPQDVP